MGVLGVLGVINFICSRGGSRIVTDFPGVLGGVSFSKSPGNLFIGREPDCDMEGRVLFSEDSVPKN